MIPVSVEWKNAIREQFRYQGYLRVVLQITPPGLHEGLQIATSATEVVSTTSKLVDENPNQPKPYATLEHNRWRLDGTYSILAKDTVTDDWWSTPITSGPKELTFTFDQAYNIPGIYVEWDVVNNSYPTNVSLVGYDNSDTQQYLFDVMNITSPTGFIDAPMDNVKKVVLTVKKWSNANWRVRINELLFGLYAKYDSINNGRVMSAKSVDYSHPLSSKLPVHTIDVSLRNLDLEFDPTLQRGISKYLATRQLVKYSWGFTTSYGVVEWTPELHYFMDEFTIPKSEKNVQLKTTSRLALLTDTAGNVPYDATERTFYDIAESVLSTSKIVREKSENPWILSEELKNFKTNAPIPDIAVNQILQYLANASGLNLYTNPVNGFVCIDAYENAESQSVDLGQEQSDPEITVQNTLRTISVEVSTYTKNVDQGKVEVARLKQLYKGENEIKLSYSKGYAVEVTCSIEGATLVTFEPYSTYAIVSFNAGDSESTVSIVLSGYEVTKTTALTEIYNNKNVSTGLDVTIENPFITDTSKLDYLSDILVNWYSKTQQLDIPYIGYPELTVGDRVDLTTVYGDSNVTVIENTIDFDGGFSGTLEVR